ncbi:MAG TPA: Swt1 family HEPN domain-containing protein [Bacillota bacterium]|nr:Swt1 family HEPN domain-containing protein [Peptococcaceae bacterium MAG4]NLW38082.1 ATP-binding protein [Peptococcaceae bacterium]HPZ43157.1 Swt1 family HEPN domain-containing protein [Bacillota bacterium]HQD75895.1 Swt1 family HEPN domain-containing protein [Bacillota bacterium]HUM58408.1 Swt1 family HEPN domain-containing protein [Bacillota bacterium]
MSYSNLERVGRGLEVLRRGLSPYIARELKAAYGPKWWQVVSGTSLPGTVGLESKKEGKAADEAYAELDVQALLLLMWNNWNEVFQAKLGHAGRSYVSELREVRNRWAHQKPFTTDDAYRALDTITRLLEAISSEYARLAKKLSRDLLRQRFEEEAKRELKKTVQEVTQTGAAPGLKPWREVITPHPDVASGRYQQAEFAADLAQVLLGEAEPEYQDPAEFFRRTYLTEGLAHLLKMALERLSGTGGDPVVQLQTSFGGGKTHSMLALYHLFGGHIAPAQIQGLEPILKELGLSQVPRARRAVLVGTDLSAAQPRVKPDGTVVNTMWGEMAYQLGGSQAYRMVAREDQQGVSPGSGVIKDLFDTYGPALVLIDEWVAFARNIYGVEGLCAGSFDANMTFAQALTEGARRSRCSMVITSIPASDIEIGGEGGQAALERLQNTFGRLESVWKPAAMEESFEIVRRRLFSHNIDYAARDAVINAFMDMYRELPKEFPKECREADYARRMKVAYPIHPELFDRLYQDWSTLERFQRTRGVLRLMAAAIHQLWEREDKSLLIMPGTLPLDSPPVRQEMTRYLPEGWPPVLDADIDGPVSKPLALDRDNPNLGRYSACRRVARTIFVGSAPSVAAQRVRGLEEVRLKLGCVQPGESPAAFGDALRRLSEQLTYMYSDNTRFWFDTRPSVNRLAADRAELMGDRVEAEIKRRLFLIKDKGDFAGVHMAPDSGADVADEQTTRLVVLNYKHYYANSGAGDSPALQAARDILENRGGGPRQYRNVLVFLATEKNRVPELERATRQYLAWKSIDAEKEELNLDVFQTRQVESNVKRANETVDARIQEAYAYLLVPTQEGTGPVTWESTRISGGSESMVLRANKKLRNAEQLITRWSPALLKMELDRWLWREQPHISIKTLWGYLTTYCYLPRLRDDNVLMETIREGICSTEYFAYASGVTDDGRYLGLRFGELTTAIYMDSSSVLVKPEAARAQIEKDAEEKRAAAAGATGGVTYPVKAGGSTAVVDVIPAGKGIADLPADTGNVTPGTTHRAVNRRFYGNVTLDSTRVARDAGTIAQEVIAHLTALVGANVEITLEITANVPDGIPEDVVRIVTENCRTLKFNNHGFENE